MNYKQKVQIADNATNILRLPCIRAAEKQSDGTIIYILYGGQIAKEGNWLIQLANDKWMVEE